MFRMTLLALVVMASSVIAGEVPLDAQKTEPLKEGASIPAVTLTGLDGQPFKLTKEVAKKPSIIVFYRGGWCPYCNTHLAELQKFESDFVGMGYQIIAVSPDQPKEINKTIQKNELKYTVVSDSKAEAAKAFGLAFKVDDATVEKYKGYGIDLDAASGESHHILPVPAVYVADKEGKIHFAHADPNYKERLDTSKLMKAIQGMEKSEAKVKRAE